MPSAEKELRRMSPSLSTPRGQTSFRSVATTAQSTGSSSLSKAHAFVSECPTFSSAWEETRYWASLALEPLVDSLELFGRCEEGSNTGDRGVEAGAEHIAALLLVRLAAVDSERQCDDTGRYSDLSTATICRLTLDSGRAWSLLTGPLSGTADDAFEGSALVSRQVRRLVLTILATYDPSLPFHNAGHAYRVVLAVRDLLDRMLCVPETQADHPPTLLPPLFGLRRDATAQLALMFAALVHDAGHMGVTNTQLAREGHPWALLYNDKSIMEHHSLSVAFQLLLSVEYSELRDCMFRGSAVVTDKSRTDPDAQYDASFRRFRSVVINAVLSTDLSNPDRAQIVKSKYREAFADHPSPAFAAGSGHSHHRPLLRPDGARAVRRGSMMSDISMPRIASGRCVHHPMPATSHLGGGSHHRLYRRGSNLSVSSNPSEATTDSVVRMMMMAAKAPSGMTTGNSFSTARRSSIASDYDSVAHMYRLRHHPRPQTDGMKVESSVDFCETAAETPRRTAGPGQRRLSNDFSVDTSGSTEYGKDSIAMILQKKSVENRGKDWGGTSPRSQHGFSSAGFGGSDHRNIHSRSQVLRRWSTTMTEKTVLTRDMTSLGASRGKYSAYDDNDDNSEMDDNSQEDSSSLSLTPPSSDDEMDGVVITGLKSSCNSSDASLPIGGAIILARKKKCNDYKSNNFPAAQASLREPSAFASRRASTGMTPSVDRAFIVQNRDDNRFTSGCIKSRESVLEDKEGRRSCRLSSSSHHCAAGIHKKRLSIRRSMDLSGELVERYSVSSSRLWGDFERRDSLAAMSVPSADSRDSEICNNPLSTNDYDEPDDLKVEVITELVLRVADVFHYFLDFGRMSRVTSDLFRELLAAHRAGRGTDPRVQGWFDSQVHAMDCYVMPLARQLDATGVFSSVNHDCAVVAADTPGSTAEDLLPLSNGSFSLVELLQSNQDKWMREGFDVIAALLEETVDG